MSKKIVIRESCNACGLCLECPHITELPNGKAVPVGAGIISDQEAAAVTEIQALCPQNAIVLENAASKSKEEIIKLIDKKIADFHLKVPTKQDLKYEEKYANFSVPGFVQGEGRYDYSSESRALDAARSAINQAMYARRGQICQEIITNYRVDKLSPYCVYNESPENFYYAANMKAKKILEELIGEVKASKPSANIKNETAVIKTKPVLEKNYRIDALNKDILYMGDAIVSEMSGEYYTLSWYVNNCDTDDYEEYAGTGMFGREKYVTKYCFRDTRKAFEEIAKDIKSECKSSFDEIIVERFSLGFVQSIVEDYEKKLKSELKQKAEEIKKLL